MMVDPLYKGGLTKPLCSSGLRPITDSCVVIPNFDNSVRSIIVVNILVFAGILYSQFRNTLSIFSLWCPNTRAVFLFICPCLLYFYQGIFSTDEQIGTFNIIWMLRRLTIELIIRNLNAEKER
ncbi:hypothetical protein SCEN_F01320 [Saccharomyces cerevisiae]|uniref:Putative uncharacterized protein YFR056C n=2 Tax=Saccharomyces cerevisiae TaxID=4932 RepID=YFM6_YEAST|nr:RecName: Full=Putative uncharacterized protein YFR056C [Saccharomyces cerevisiae S288C]AAT93259.1 YFR056C [Saccharomyces cerevisiae]WNV72326.1 hypothetical protein O6U65_1074 [Saccharomyces cerevisiae synthetic construct]CAY79507.1 EC1118_1F29_0001p [Saccharomyces cerevisiae EC1118]QHB08393.1 hypothetical protein SCEN_F01320 [Saccharomyces cerevisiae]BAA09294.1 unnamed protein product [Saccharomyces cerevisiae]